ncbi:MAG: murein biosynthesis integral membrane protein MurJ [Rhodospirillales bacterium]
MILLRSIATVGGMTMVSRAFGFLRDILIAALLGAGMMADAFFIAFKLPNLFRRLFAEGAFSAAFVPIFAGLVEDEGKAAARAFADQALSVLLWFLLVLVVAFELAMPWIMLGFAPGFADEPEKFALTVELTRITFPYLLFISLVSLMAGVLNSLGRFAAAAATPILLNLCLIGAIVGLSGVLGSPAHALAWGVFGAGVAQLLWMLFFCLRADMPLRVRLPRMTPMVRRLIRRIVPVALGAGVYQVNLVIDMVIASLLPSGSVSFLFFADRINQLPLGVIGVAVGTALLPLLTRQLHAGDAAAAMHSQNRALEVSLLLTVPAAAALAIIAEPVTAVLFGRGAFAATDVAATAAALAAYAYGLPAYVLIKTLTPGYFAREDTKTPVVISVICLAVNLVLNLILMGPFLHVGIAIATAVSAWLNAGLLAIMLRRRGHLILDGRFKSRFVRMSLAVAGMIVALMVGQAPLARLLAGGEIERILALGCLIGLGFAVFAALAWAFGAARPADLKSLLGRRKTETPPSVT